MEDEESHTQTREPNCVRRSTLSVLEALFFWRDVRISSLAFGGSLVVLLSLSIFSFISLVSNLLLALLSITITFRIYKSVFQAIQKTARAHPFQVFLEKDISITAEEAQRYMDMVLPTLNHILIQTRHFLLVEDMVDSLKLAVLTWFLTYVGGVFNSITLLIMADIFLFCTPLIYEKHKVRIDGYVELVRTELEAKLEKLYNYSPVPLDHTSREATWSH